MSTSRPPLIGVGIYGVAEAARLSRVSSSCIRRWLRGYSYRTAVGQRAAAPVFNKAMGLIDGEMALSFLDLIEVRIVNSLRAQKISWKLIRMAERHARDVLKVDHPFATKTFKTDGRSIFADLRKSHGERPLIDLADNQLAFRKIIEPHLKDIDFDEESHAARWWPISSGRRVLLDPQRSFGQPIVREGVPTSVLARAAKREQSVETVAKWFEVQVRAVRDAIQFERNLAA